jgi:putative salt-induced outer membrane protein YdiY
MQIHSKTLRTVGCALGLAFVAMLSSGTAAAETLILANGDKITADIVEETDAGIVVEHPDFGRMEIPAGAYEIELPKPINPGLFGTAFLRGWDRQVGFGFNGAQGNSQGASVNAALNLSGEGEHYRGKFGAGYFFGKQRNNDTGATEKNTNSAFVDYRHDFLYFGDAPIFPWANLRYDYDEFQDFVNRLTGQGGLGWEILKKEKVDLNFELGAGFNRSWGDVDDTIPEGVAGLRFVWRVIEGQKFTANVTYYPDLMEFSSYRVLADGAYEISLGFIDGLGLKFGVQDEYRSKVTPPPGAGAAFPNANNNLKYYGNLTYSF